MSPTTTKVPARDPETGKFVAGHHGHHGHFEDYEVVTVQQSVAMPADKLDGSTGESGGNVGRFEGVQLIDYDELVDRNETLHLVHASHHMVVYQNSTATADGTVKGELEVSASPARVVAADLDGFTEIDDAGPELSIPEADQRDDSDSIDILGRVLQAVGHGPFSDGATGVGGAGTAGIDEVTLHGLPAVVAEFHPRDELFMNGAFTVWNVADAAVHLDLSLQHVYGVVSD